MFVALIANTQVDAKVAIPAPRRAAGAQATIGFVKVSIITGFVAGVMNRSILPQEPIAAASEAAPFDAIVSVALVAIVARLPALLQAVTAAQLGNIVCPSSLGFEAPLTFALVTGRARGALTALDINTLCAAPITGCRRARRTT